MNSPIEPGLPATSDMWIDVQALLAAYYERPIDVHDPAQRVSFGTSGHRGTALLGTFNDAHIAAITQSICEYRERQGISGPLFLGKDTHALSVPAEQTALEVLEANRVAVHVSDRSDFVPTPVISRAILHHNRQPGRSDQADGIVITPSHNPPSDGGFKYNPPHGGPADTEVTTRIQQRANELLAAGNQGVRRETTPSPSAATTVQRVELIVPYVEQLEKVIDFDCIRRAGLQIAVDPLGGAAIDYWQPIATSYGIDLVVVNPTVDPRFHFMPLDHDLKIRMDCSSPPAMANLLRMKDQYDIAFANDPDADRHGIVTPSCGLMNPNHFLAVAIEYLFQHRPEWPDDLTVGKTAVSSSIIDRVAATLGRRVVEVPVGFKWFVPGLSDGSCAFGGEESAGASFLCRDGSTWTTDKDGLIMGLLAAEITARTGADPGVHFQRIARQLGTPYYRRIDRPARATQRQLLKQLSGDAVTATTLAGEPIRERLTNAPGNQAPLGGLKVVTDNGWFAARPSGTEDIYKIYAESFLGEDHLERILSEAQQIVAMTFSAADSA